MTPDGGVTASRSSANFAFRASARFSPAYSNLTTVCAGWTPVHLTAHMLEWGLGVCLEKGPCALPPTYPPKDSIMGLLPTKPALRVVCDRPLARVVV